MSRILTIKETAQLLLSRDSFLLLTHKNPDGDTVCSAAALCSALRRNGKTAYIARNDEIIEKLREYSDPFTAPEDYKYECVVAVDCATEEMFARIYSGPVYAAIDHHPTNSRYAENLLLDDDKSACGEIVLALIEEMNGALTKPEAEMLYVALITDNGCFQYANTNSASFLAAAKLVNYGIDNGALSVKFIRKQSFARIKLEAEMYSDIRRYRDGKIIILRVSQAMLNRCGCTENDLSDLAGLAGRCEGSVVNITLREQSDGTTKVSVRTTPEVSASDICARFGGGGHFMAAGCNIPSGLNEAEAQLLQVIDEVWA